MTGRGLMLPNATAGRPLVDGVACAPAAVLSAPLSFWGGFDPVTGTITDIHHPEHGQSIAGKAVIMTTGRGSSSASSVLVEAVRLGSAPAAFVLTMPDEIVVLGAIVADELYQVTMPVIVLDAQTHGQIVTGENVIIEPGGLISTE